MQPQGANLCFFSNNLAIPTCGRAKSNQKTAPQSLVQSQETKIHHWSRKIRSRTTQKYFSKKKESTKYFTHVLIYDQNLAKPTKICSQNSVFVVDLYPSWFQATMSENSICHQASTSPPFTWSLSKGILPKTLIQVWGVLRPMKDSHHDGFEALSFWDSSKRALNNIDELMGFRGIGGVLFCSGLPRAQSLE